MRRVRNLRCLDNLIREKFSHEAMGRLERAYYEAGFHRHAHKRMEAIRCVARIEGISFSTAMSDAAAYVREMRWQCLVSTLGDYEGQCYRTGQDFAQSPWRRDLT